MKFVTLKWEVHITPATVPVLNYTISYWLSRQSRDDAISIETPRNNTTFDLQTLLPGSTYNVVVGGRNVVGLGADSAPATVVTMRGEVPPAPEGVGASVVREEGGEGAVLTVTWQVRRVCHYMWLTLHIHNLRCLIVYVHTISPQCIIVLN